ncbi:MAG: hypothetical protein DCC65_00240 [Planctomycetota bacterium]|nr:MAG: hypothetical protein DCC65_00240 [Planctomycetota bacterium]
MRLMILENKRLRSVMPFDGTIMSVGSSPNCTVQLPDPRISPEQVKFFQDETGAWWMEVLDTTSPTSLNRAIQKGRARLRHADEIELGPFSIRFFAEHKSPEELQRERLAALSRTHGESLPLGAIIKRFDHGLAVHKDQMMEITLLAMKLAQFDVVRDLLPPILRALHRMLSARRAWTGLRHAENADFDWNLGITDQGQPCDRPAYSHIMQSRCLAETQFVCCPETPSAGIKSAMATPLPCAAGNLGMLYVENDSADSPFTEESLDLMSAMACAIAPVAETVIRKATAKRLAVTTTEHTVARATQDAVTPKALPQWNELQIAAYRHMGSARCCDYYDIVQLPDKTCALIVAKVSAEGPAVPRYLAELRSAFRCAALHCDAPHLFARSLNWLLSSGEGKCLIDLATAWIAPVSGKVNFCMAGPGVHIGVILPNGDCRKLDPKRSEPIGRAKNLTLELQSIDLGHGQTAVFATSGIHAAVSSGGETFGLSGLEEALCDALGDAPGQVLSELSTDLTEFLKGGSCPDDVSVVLVRRA